MRPILFEFFGVPLASWYVFFSLAGTAAYFYSRYLLRLMSDMQTVQSRELNVHGILFSTGYIAGWFGARILSVLREELGEQGFWAKFLLVFELGSMTFYGGALAATLGGVVLGKFLKLNLSHCFLAFVPAGVLALGIGRIGCFLNGDDFGRVLPHQDLSIWWAHITPSLGDHLLRYPVQLQEAFFSILLACVFPWFIKRSGFKGGAYIWSKPVFLSASCVFLSASNRFLNEFFRGDPRGNFWGTQLSTSQGIALILMGICVAFIGSEVLNAVKLRPQVDE